MTFFAISPLQFHQATLSSVLVYTTLPSSLNTTTIAYPGSTWCSWTTSFSNKRRYTPLQSTLSFSLSTLLPTDLINTLLSIYIGPQAVHRSQFLLTFELCSCSWLGLDGCSNHHSMLPRERLEDERNTYNNSHKQSNTHTHRQKDNDQCSMNDCSAAIVGVKRRCYTFVLF